MGRVGEWMVEDGELRCKITEFGLKFLNVIDNGLLKCYT